MKIQAVARLKEVLASSEEIKKKIMNSGLKVVRNSKGALELNGAFATGVSFLTKLFGKPSSSSKGSNIRKWKSEDHEITLGPIGSSDEYQISVRRVE